MRKVSVESLVMEKMIDVGSEQFGFPKGVYVINGLWLLLRLKVQLLYSGEETKTDPTKKKAKRKI